MARKCSREKALTMSNPERSLNHPVPWYPECSGFYVCELKKGDIIINYVCILIDITIAFFFQANTLFFSTQMAFSFKTLLLVYRSAHPCT